MNGATRPIALSIAGFDPSGGAGVLADIKTFENTGVYGLGACSAITFQNDSEFIGVDWLTEEQIVKQLVPLLNRFDIKTAKFGIVRDLTVFSNLVSLLTERGIKIVWDPIVSASAGFVFHQTINSSELEDILPRLSLITPNWNEIEVLAPGDSQIDATKKLSEFCPVLLKGGHAPGDSVTDYLISNGEVYEFSAPRFPGAKKHGSGCVLSAAITAALAKGLSLVDSCNAGRGYVRNFLLSNNNLLGYHL